MIFEKAINGAYCREVIDTKFGMVPIKVWGQTKNDASNNLEIEFRMIARLDAMEDRIVIATVLKYYGGSSTSDEVIYRLPNHIDDYLQARFPSL